MLLIALGLTQPAMAGPTSIQTPISPRPMVAEARDLAQTFGGRIWPGMNGVPFTVLLLYPHKDVLSCVPGAPKGFTPVPVTDRTLCVNWQRPASDLPRNMQATLRLPGIANPVTVIGTPAATHSNAGAYVLTLLHEHFHQMQMAQPGYAAAANALDLARGDKTGWWMLNYPFAYDDPKTAELVAQLSHRLAMFLQTNDAKQRLLLAKDYARTRARLMAQLGPDDRKYMELQLWQEGVARYTELLFCEYAASAQGQGRRAAFSYADLALNLRTNLVRELQMADLSREKRTIFYPMGAAEALLLDTLHPDWKAQYFQHKFTMAPLFQTQSPD